MGIPLPVFPKSGGRLSLLVWYTAINWEQTAGAQAIDSPQRVVLGSDSTEIPSIRSQEGTERYLHNGIEGSQSAVAAQALGQTGRCAEPWTQPKNK
jgi:hypothetical protein